MKMNQSEIAEFRKDFNRVMKELEEKYDITVSLGRITYSAEQFSARLTVDNSRDPETIARNNFDEEVWKYADIGLMPGMYRQVFVGKDRNRYAIEGFIPNARKNPLKIVRISDRKPFRAPRSFIDTVLNEKYEPNQENS